MPELLITFHGDWRIGTGKGSAGELDDLARRDPRGMPVVPATTVTGMMRDGCERVAAALDRGTDADGWRAWVDLLFGSQPGRDGRHDRVPVPAALSLRTATLGEALVGALQDRPNWVRSLYSVRPGVALDPVTKQAKTDYLRMVEVVRGGLELRAPLELADDGWDDAQRATAWLLLALGAEQVTELGGDRRRGLGRCTLELSALPAPVLAALAAEQPPRPAAPPAESASATGTAVATSSAWTTIEFQVRCIDPVLSATAVTEGTVRGTAVVPGARVLPVIIARARAAGIDVELLVRSGGLECDPLHPEIGSVAGRPAPRCLVQPKGRPVGQQLWNQLRQPAPKEITAKPIRDLWLGAGHGPTIDAGKPELEVRVHNTIHDPVQRPTEEVGGLYSYEVIPADSRLRGTVRLRVPADAAEQVASALTGRWRLGGSKKDEYGRVDVTATVVTPANRPVPGARQACLWFRTDAVVLDDRLAPVCTVDQLVAAVGDRLGTPLRLADVPEGCRADAVAFARAEGWQTKWTRPRPTLVVVAAGSTVLVQRTDGKDFTSAVLTELAEQGLGERRAEGFGMLAVNDPLLDAPSLIRSHPGSGDEDVAAAAVAALTDAERALIEQLKREALRREVEHRATTLPRDQLGALAELPPAQLGNVRNAVNRIAVAQDPSSAAERLLSSIRRARTRDRRWSREAEQALSKLLAPDAVWERLGIPAADRLAELEPWARARLVAHLTAGGATAGGEGERNSDGA
ncbi:MAG: RAMP superfamily CRISPR-associated protein [Pseudonocardiales bacterium]